MAYKRISPMPVVEGGTGRQTLTNHGVLVGAATAAITQLSVGTNGQVLIGATGADPAFATLTSTGSTITFTTGANSLNLEAAASVPTSFATDSGTATPAANTITIAGGNNIGTTGSGSTVTINLNDTTNHAVQVGNAGGSLTSVSPSATSGVPLISQGASADPTFGTAVVAGGGTGAVTFTAYAVICAGTTSTGAFQNVSGVGTSGQVLTSTGAGALPTWQSPASGFTWSVITVNQTAAVNNGYICNKAGTLALALPASSAVGSIIEVTGINTATGWQITQAAGQQIFFGNTSTTSGATGTLTSTAIRDSIRIVCVVADLTWNVLSSIGNITVV